MRREVGAPRDEGPVRRAGDWGQRRIETFWQPARVIAPSMMAQRRYAVSSGHTSAVVGITDVFARERVDDPFVARGAAPGVSNLSRALSVSLDHE
jgi:hypothetical protein